MTPTTIVLVALLLLLVADTIVRGVDEGLVLIRKRRALNALRSIKPWLYAEPYPPTMAGVTQALAYELPVVEVAIIESKQPPARVLVHLRLSWWTALGLGWFHRRARSRAVDVLEQVVPVNVEAAVGEVTVGRLPR